jgi:hypothetical protein
MVTGFLVHSTNWKFAILWAEQEVTEIPKEKHENGLYKFSLSHRADWSDCGRHSVTNQNTTMWASLQYLLSGHLFYSHRHRTPAKCDFIIQCINMLPGNSNFMPMLMTPEKYYIIDHRCKIFSKLLLRWAAECTSQTDFYVEYSLKSKCQRMQNLIHKHKNKNTVNGKERLLTAQVHTCMKIWKQKEKQWQNLSFL